MNIYFESFTGDFVSSSIHDLEDIGQISTFLQDIQVNSILNTFLKTYSV